tara:strand:+ start:340 stop:639 length:300 start_codon:yes stop_codon:yes gene_type:complete
MTSELSVSRQYTLCCESVIRLLAEADIGASAFANHSSVKGRVEKGCRITFENDSDLLPAWRLIKDRFGFTCAHVKTASYSGCVKGYCDNDNPPTPPPTP